MSDGKLRGFRRPDDAVAASDRAPQYYDLNAADVPALGAAGKVFKPQNWARWLLIEDDGGAPLLIETQDGKKHVAPTNKFVFLPTGYFRVSDNGVAPTTIVKFSCLSQDDALVVAPSVAAMAAGGSTAAAQNVWTHVSTPAVDDSDPPPIFAATLIPGSAPGVRMTIQSYVPELAAGFPPISNDPDSLICVADSEANAEAGIGTLLTPGGTTDVEGEIWICEVQYVDDSQATESHVSVQVIS
jgi:hypothetical protein